MSEPLASCIVSGRRRLERAGFRPDDAAIDADVLARHVLGWDRARMLARNQEPASAEFVRRFDALIARRERREPVAFITGSREFWGLHFEVTPATLVPRPESELIVEAALQQLPADLPAILFDIGTGTGCLAVAIAHERRLTRVVATDVSMAALHVAQRNARAHGVADRVRFVCTDLAGGVRNRADVIVSNPPYVPETAAPALQKDVVAYEPGVALFGGADGLVVIRRLLHSAARSLSPRGALIFEFGLGQDDTVQETAEALGWKVAGMLHDLQGIARTIVLRR